MMSQADRSKAADILIAAEKERKQAVQLSKTWPDITIEDAYAISTEVANRKIAAGAKLIGHKVGLTSKAMQRSSQIDEPDYGHLLDYMMVADGARVRARELLPAAGRDRTRLHAGQAAARVPASACPTCCARPNTSCRRSRSSTRGCRTRARFSTPSPTTAPPPASSSADGRSDRWTSICAGSAASCTATPRSRRPASPPACSAIRRSASPGSPTSSASTASTLEPGHLVLAGSFTRVVFARKGDTLHADFGPLGGIAVQFV